MMRHRWVIAGSALVCAGALALASGTASARPAGGPAARPSAASAGRAPAAGKFVLVGSSNVVTGVPGILVTSAHVGYVAWPTSKGGKADVQVAQVAKSGAVGNAKSGLSGSWSSIGGQLTLVPGTQQPQLVYDGVGTGQFTPSCIYVATGSSLPWTAQNGSLSQDCANPEPAGAESSSGTIAATWSGAGGTNVRYRIGVSSSIPASGSDGVITVAATVAGNGITWRPSDQHFLVSWIEANGSKDGYYAADVSGSPSPQRMPGTGPNSVNNLARVGDLPMASTSHGAYLAACSNTLVNCRLMLWKVGASKAKKVPGAKAPYTAALAAGPSGRLWVAWGVQTNNTVKVTRTNKKDTKFGPVRTYHTACIEHEIVAISGPADGGADIALECGATIHNKFMPVVYATHVLPALSAHPSVSGHTVTVKVTDAGDAISGAKVTLGGATKKTSSKGVATFHVGKAGHYAVVAKHSGYLAAHAKATVK